MSPRVGRKQETQAQTLVAYHPTGCDRSPSVLLDLLVAIPSAGSIEVVTNVA